MIADEIDKKQAKLEEMKNELIQLKYLQTEKQQQNPNEDEEARIH